MRAFGNVIYTDGSKIQNSVGCAFVHSQESDEIFSEPFRLSDEASVFMAEVVAIRQAVGFASCDPLFRLHGFGQVGNNYDYDYQQSLGSKCRKRGNYDYDYQQSLVSKCGKRGNYDYDYQQSLGSKCGKRGRQTFRKHLQMILLSP
ncbi:hypothetical protein AVEN_247997-1, partial [Araneus ventricosus]